MKDIHVVITDDGATMSAKTDKGREKMPQDVVFDTGKAAFFLPANLAHFDASGITYEVDDQRKAKPVSPW